MSDDRSLNDTLKRLPRVAARPDFTARVLARTAAGPDALPDERTSPWIPALIAATAMLAVLVAVWGSSIPVRRDPTVAFGSLLAEHHQLSEELSSLRELNQRSRPVLRLDGDDQFDYVLPAEDLRALPRRGVVLPASYTLGAETY